MSWRGHMFGLTIESASELVGCEPDDAVEVGLPRLRLRPSKLDPLGRGARTLTWWAGEPDLVHEPATGFRLQAPGLGAFQVSPQGDVVSYAATGGPAWRWQRYLIGRVLPFAATLLGYEPLHASAVAHGDGVVLLAGESGSGKTTLAAELMLAGLRFVTDDVVALSLRDGELLAHPGPGLMSLRGPYQFGETVGRHRGDRWTAVPRVPRALPVTALYLLQRGGGPGIEPVTRPDPAALLAASFNLALTDPVRLTRQLDVFSALAHVPAARIGVTSELDFRALADELQADLRIAVGA